MSDQNIIKGLLLDEATTLSIVEVCIKCDISEEALLELLEQGLCHLSSTTSIDEHILSRIQSACRIQQDLGVNAPGAVLVMELLDELKQMRRELAILQRHMNVS